MLGWMLLEVFSRRKSENQRFYLDNFMLKDCNHHALSLMENPLPPIDHQYPNEGILMMEVNRTSTNQEWDGIINVRRSHVFNRK